MTNQSSSVSTQRESAPNINKEAEKNNENVQSVVNQLESSFNRENEEFI